MDPQPADLTLLRFKTFWITLAMFLVFGVVGLVVRSWTNRTSPNGGELNAEADKKREDTLGEVRAAQIKSVRDMGIVYQDPQGGHLPKITVPDVLIAKAVAQLKKNPPHSVEALGPIPGSKTFLERQPKHDPVESEFLKK